MENCCPCLPETSGQDAEIPWVKVKLYPAASCITQELYFEDHKAFGNVMKAKHIPVCSLALAQVLYPPWFSNVNPIEREKMQFFWVIAGFS